MSLASQLRRIAGELADCPDSEVTAVAERATQLSNDVFAAMSAGQADDELIRLGRRRRPRGRAAAAAPAAAARLPPPCTQPVNRSRCRVGSCAGRPPV